MNAELPVRPRLRAVEITPLEGGAEPRFLLQDPAGFLEAPLQLSAGALLLLSALDGRHDLEAVGQEFTRRTGQTLERVQIEEFVASLDRSLLLDTPRFAEARRRALAEFTAGEWRPAAHAGGAYAGDAAELGAQLDQLLAAGAGAEAREPLCALMAPHIDLHRGGRGYGLSYAALQGQQAPDVVVVIGTGHAADEGRFILCPLGFETPRGNLPLDQEFLGRLEGRLSRTYRRGMLAHRREHSVEFQALLLAHLFAIRHEVTLVPILATSFDDCMRSEGWPEDDPEIAEFLGALRETVEDESRRLLVVAGADLSHVGRQFGDDRDLDEGFLRQVRERDQMALAGAATGEARQFFAAVADHGNEHRICSVASIYATLHATRPTSGDTLVYEQAVDPAGQLAVTYAGMAFRRPDRGLAGV